MNQQQATSQASPNQHINTAPNPDRFVVYNILPGEFGFTIPNCDFVFEFDRHGGWFDEYGNYYNAQGEPAGVPVEYEGDIQGDVQYGYYVDETNSPSKENERPEEKEDPPLEFYDNQHLNKENKETIDKYPEGGEIEVELHNLSPQWNEDGFENFLIDSKIEWIIFEFEYDDQEHFKGTCYISLNKANALKLIEFNGYTMLGKNLNIIVMEPKQQQANKDPEPSQPSHANGNGMDQKSQAKAPKEEEKTLENDRNEITFKRPYPQGKPMTSADLEAMQEKSLDTLKKKAENGEINADGRNKISNKGD